jgi:hypothetical protein
VSRAVERAEIERERERLNKQVWISFLERVERERVYVGLQRE